ncbi:response regulator [Nostoc sp. 'Lobaria pulmonaria (5183) cyanobiont']|uniref:response regulator n=1 Tax=Nostoc sp. 'Lobaria pulmonaria (5183) cyanobiont' TaxID=1618022 RepID=UPI000CF3311E|nr:response regulator [Nostoc sp. 'Lobaria pulmonaria (5183) cyanobiont']AVH73069.1 response regulator receiver protein [Nostoc sp. 'Lobaria pulmonaria (5183) cyanobiont']
MATDQKINQETELNSLQHLIGTTILLVEDEPDIADLLTFILETAGAEVMALSDAETALDLIESLHPDILVCNVKLPDHDGNWLIEQIRVNSCSSIRELPAIAITSYTREVSSHKALNAGFNRFLVKLESPEEIVDEIVSLLSIDP